MSTAIFKLQVWEGDDWAEQAEYEDPELAMKEALELKNSGKECQLVKTEADFESGAISEIVIPVSEESLAAMREERVSLAEQKRRQLLEEKRKAEEKAREAEEYARKVQVFEQVMRALAIRLPLAIILGLFLWIGVEIGLKVWANS